MQKSLKIVLDKLMKNEGFNVQALSKRSNVAEDTLKNWLHRGTRPRYWQQLLQVADALALSEQMTDQLLTAANKPTLSKLRRVVSETKKPADIILLSRWQPIVLGLSRPPLCLGNEKVINDAVAVLTARDDTQPVCLLRGMAGVGKTTLAQEIAHRVRPTFTDGVLWVDLHDDDSARLTTILAEFAHAHQIPIDRTLSLDALSLRVRSALAGKNILIILDDVQTREQINLFRPDNKHGALLLTTRSRAVRPPLGTQVIDVKPFGTTDETVTLFREILGAKRVARETNAFAEIAHLIGNLPLAATIVAQRLAMDDDWSASEFLEEELRPEHARLSALEYDDLSVRVSFNLSYQQLSSVRQNHFVQLAIFDGESFTIDAAAHVLAISASHTKTILRELHHSALLQKVEDGRYRLHQLLSQYAHDFLSGKEAQSRKIAYYITLAQTHQHDERTLSKEINNIRTALDGALAQQLEHQFVEGILATYTLLFDRSLHEQVTTYLNKALTITETSSITPIRALKGRVLIALAHVATRLNQGDVAHEWIIQAELLADENKGEETQIMSGRVKGELSRYSDPTAAITHWQTALTVAKGLDVTDEISALSYNLAGQYVRTHQFELAAPLITDCIRLAKETGNNRLRSLTLALQGHALIVQGEYEAANDKYRDAYTIAETIQNSRHLFMLSLSRGYLARLQGRYPAAHRLYIDALSKTVPTMRQHILIRSNLADVLTWQGQYKEARNHLDRASALLAEHDDQSVGAILFHDLGQLELRQKGDMDKARLYFEKGLTVAQAHDDVERIIQAQLALGDLYRRVGEGDAAANALSAALTLAQQTKNIADQTLATYGRAQLTNNIPQAEQCYGILNKMGHYRAKSLQVWLKKAHNTERTISKNQY